MLQGNSTAALADAQGAAASDPVSAEPLWELSEIYSARRNPTAAREELVKAVNIQPSNPETYDQLGQYDLAHNQAIVAVLEFQTAQFLDRSSPTIAQQLAAAESAVSQSGLSAPPAPAASG
ncbi:MAG: tetratricopeptide repeat protein, partial [Solirubrobacteraceae bacterium]